MPIEPNTVYTSFQAAEVMQLSIDTIRKAAARGEIRGTKRGAKGWRFVGQSLIDFINKKYETENNR